VLSKLGAEVLSVNPYASTRQSLTFDRWEHAAQVSELVRASGAHLGAVIHTDGEYITLVDNNGHILTDDEGLMALLYLVLADADRRGGPPPTVALPVSVGRAVESMCDDAGATLLWTKLSTPHLMEVASGPGVRFGASQEGGYIFPSFLPAYDAVATLVETLALLASSGAPMSQVVGRLPPLRVAHEAVVTPWEKKGLVMRMVMEWAKDRDLLLVDGVKVLHEDGWALVFPDPEEPLTHVWAEAGTDAAGRARAQEYARRIRNVLRS
jgi:mannose-1-phosphate guanylyltransferase/phosphomannomutase